MHCAPYLCRRVADHLRVGHRRRVEADLVGAGVEQPAHVVHRAHAAAHGERDEDLRGHRLDDVQDQVAPVAGGGDVEEGQLVGALLVVARGDLHRVAGVAQFDEVDALDDPAAGDVEAGNDAFGEHGAGVRPRRSSSSARACAGGEVEVAGVDGAAADHALDAFALDRAELLDVGHVRQAARGDDRNRQRLRQLDGGLDVDAGEHAVAADVGVDHAFDAVVLELLAPGRPPRGR